MPRYPRPRPKQKEANRPSNFFIIALLIGIAILAIAFSRLAVRKTEPATTTQQQSTTR